MLTLDDLPPVMLGGAVFNQQYNDDPENLEISKMVKTFFDYGWNGIDSSVYYGPSEILLGKVLKNLDRTKFFICTKTGRFGENSFDYSAKALQTSVEQSLARFGTTYLDILYIHDVEFVDFETAIAAVKYAQALKATGLVRYVGLSGYPVEYLVKLCQRLQQDGCPADVVLSYSNLCLQNTRLKKHWNEFVEAGVKKIVAASPLSMSLLRSADPVSFHPAPQELKQRVHGAAQRLLQEHNVELADLATRFAYRNTPSTTVIGLSSPSEVEAAIANFRSSKDPAVTRSDDALVEEFRKAMGEYLDYTWDSGNIKGSFVRSD